MSPERNPAVACEPDLVLLHPAGSSDPQRVSLAIGLLEWLRLWLESRGVHSSLWPETVTDARGLRHFILRPTPWKPTDLRHKIQLVPTADAIVTLDFEADRSRIRLLDRRGDSLAASVIRLVPEDLLSVLPDTLDQLLGALDRPHSPLTGKELFKTEDGRTAIAALYALERFVAFRFGVGRDDPNRLFEPILQCLEREPSHPIARECMTRIAASLALSTAEGDRQAAFHAIGRWAELAPHSPVPLFHMAVLKQQAGDAEGARGAYTESLLRDPFYLPSLQGYAEWLASHGFLDQSVDLLTQAVGRTGFDGNLLDHAGCLLANQGRTEAAEPLSRRAVKAAGPATAYTNLARALLSLGRDDEALEVAQAGWMQSPEPDQLDLLSEIAERPGLAGASARAILRGRISEGSEDESVLEKLMRVSVEIDGLAAGAATARKLLEVASRPEVRRAAYAVLLESRMEDFESRWEKAVADAVQGLSLIHI
ncbi:MAG: hypothetical protein QUU85_01890 [Candidatus Eisenbacteria bacterium]|nr:hypothetical protein [Candidatus Eisenbacteria bacterium]